MANIQTKTGRQKYTGKTCFKHLHQSSYPRHKRDPRDGKEKSE